MKRWTSPRFWLQAALCVCGTSTLFLALFIAFIFIQLPNPKTLAHIHYQIPMQIFSANHKLIAEFGSKDRLPAHLKEIPPLMQKAVVAIEDRRFYDHYGVDPIGLVRAAKAVISSGQKVQGASTITMQVARNFFLDSKKNYLRKIKEILLAFSIEHHFSKDQILEMYLNQIYFGQQAYGIKAAARNYYGKSLDQLTLSEMAMLAGLPKAPSKNNPIRRPESAIARRNHILSLMHQDQSITTDDYDAAVAAPVSASVHRASIQVKAPYIAELIRNSLVKHYGEKAYAMGLKITSTIQSDLQAEAEKSIKEGLLQYAKRHPHSFHEQSLSLYPPEEWPSRLRALPEYAQQYPVAIESITDQKIDVINANEEPLSLNIDDLKIEKPTSLSGEKDLSSLFKIGEVIYLNQTTHSLAKHPYAQAALIANHPATGAVLALQGGYDFIESHFNRITQSWRQPGSLIKPFIFASALKNGYTLSSLINDAPITREGGGENIVWRPGNHDHRFYGDTSLRKALYRSRNLISVRLVDSIGIPTIIDDLKQFDFSPEKIPKALSLSLGSLVTTPLQMNNAFASLANNGTLSPSFLVSNIENLNNADFETSELKNIAIAPGLFLFQQPSHVSLPENIAFLINDALRDVIQKGTGQRVKKHIKRTDIGGKTGSTNDFKDAWFSGSHPELCTTIWMGYDDNRSLNEYGASAVLPIWSQFMKHALSTLPPHSFDPPEGIITARIDPLTGQLSNEESSVFELFTQKQFSQLNS